jgi:sugar O-acyltransferase (sialic acid O-acetyltransferase NeuD family)
MKKDLIIIGAGNVGGFLALNQNLFEDSFNIIGFLDDDKDKQGKVYWNIPVLGVIDQIEKYQNVSVVIGLSNPLAKKKILEKIGKNFNFPNFISNKAWISNEVVIGKGVIIYPGVSINHESEIGNFVVINMNCAIGHNSIIHECCSLAPGVNFAGFTYVESYVEIGIGVSTIQKIKIGEGSRIGGQSIVITNVEKNTTYIGVPAVKK